MKANTLIGGVIVLALIAGGMWYAIQLQSPLGNLDSSEDEEMGTTTEDVVSIPIKEEDRPDAPVATGRVQFASAVSSATKTRIEQELAQVRADIAENEANLSAWNRLGELLYEAGDYKKAQAVWEYVVVVWPNYVNALFSLGTIYEKHTKEYAKAESVYRKGTSMIVPGYSAAQYRLVYEFYVSTGHKMNTETPIQWLQQGIARNAQAVDLRVLLARHYAELGRMTEAKAEYEAAIQAAEKYGHTELAAALQTELSQVN